MMRTVVGTVASFFLAAPFVPSALAVIGIPEALPWHVLVSLLTLSLAALLFFVRSWMSTREKSEDGFRKDVGAILGRVASMTESIGGLSTRLGSHLDDEEKFQLRTVAAIAQNDEAHVALGRDLLRLEVAIERGISAARKATPARRRSPVDR